MILSFVRYFGARFSESYPRMNYFARREGLHLQSLQLDVASISELLLRLELGCEVCLFFELLKRRLLMMRWVALRVIEGLLAYFWLKRMGFLKLVGASFRVVTFLCFEYLEAEKVVLSVLYPFHESEWLEIT